MTVEDDLIDRLSSETGRLLDTRARTRRKRALGTITQYCVTVTEDGKRTRDLLFPEPPTLTQLAAVAGSTAFIVAVTMRRETLREKFRLRLASAAE